MSKERYTPLHNGRCSTLKNRICKNRQLNLFHAVVRIGYIITGIKNTGRRTDVGYNIACFPKIASEIIIKAYTAFNSGLGNRIKNILKFVGIAVYLAVFDKLVTLCGNIDKEIVVEIIILE